MKNLLKTQTAFGVLIAVLTLTSGCVKDLCQETVSFIANVPVYMSYDELRSAVKSMPPRALQNPGKIYYKDKYIFINERGKGVHVIDNINPASPVNISFISIPGNFDIAIKDNIMFVDSYVDLVAIDLTDPMNVTVPARVERAFPYPDTKGLYQADPAKGVVIDYKKERKTEKVNCREARMLKNNNEPMFFTERGMAMTMADASNGSGRMSEGKGIAGSMARFAIADNMLYTVDESNMRLFDITVAAMPVMINNNIQIGRGIETIFPYQSRLFIGSQTGMFIYDITTPASPSYLGTFTHATGCDPVVVKGNFAYVTIRSGNNCGRTEDELNVVSIVNPRNPILYRTYPMTSPYGLGVFNNALFLCDGNDGLKIYDITDPGAISNNQLYHFTGMSTYDVIPQAQTIMVIGSDGLYQYSYNESYVLSFLSMIPVERM